MFCGSITVIVVAPWLLCLDQGYSSLTMVTVAGPWLPLYDNANGYCIQIKVIVVVSWFLVSNHYFSNVVRSCFLWSDHGYYGQTMVKGVGPWLLCTDHSTVKLYG